MTRNKYAGRVLPPKAGETWSEAVARGNLPNPTNIAGAGIDRPWSSGGGGGSPKPTPSAPSGGIDYEAQRQAELKAQQEAERLRIETERAKLVNQARQDYLKAVQRGSSRNERTNALNQLNQRIAQADIQAQSGREQAGISKVTRTPTRTNVQVISGGRETAVAEALRKGYGETDLRENVFGGTAQTTQTKKNISDLGFDLSTISGRAKYYLIEKDPILSRLAKAIKRFEEKKIQDPSELSKLNEQLKKRFKELTPQGTGKGWSLTQKYFETIGKGTELLGLGGITFYKKGEREKLVSEKLKDFTSAKTYEEQQNAINQLRNQGINIIQEGENYRIDTNQALQTFAPTSKLGNTLVGLTDIMFKAKVFSPFMEMGAVKKGTTTAKVKQEITYKRKFSDLSDIEYSNVINKIRIEKSVAELRDAFRKALKSKNEALIKDTGKILKDVMGEASATTLVRDVMAQEGFSAATKPVSTATRSIPTLEVEIGDLFNVPIIKGISGTTTAISVLDIKKEDNIFFRGFGENKFEGTAPSGKIESMTGQGRISSLGELGRLKTSDIFGTKFDTSQQTKQETQQRAIQKVKNILSMSQPTRQQPSLRQPVLSLLGLSSLLKTQQKQQQRYKQIQKTQQRLKEPTKPRFPTPKIFFGTPLESGLGKVKQMKEQGFFDVYIRKGGKDIKAGTKRSLQEAGQFLTGTLRKTLRASGFIQKSGKKVKLSDYYFGEEFRPSKREAGRLVEKAKYRLNWLGEVKEIQKARRNKSKSKKLKWW